MPHRPLPATILLAGLLAPAAHAELRWEPGAAAPRGLERRRGHAITYDSVRGVVVLFGGEDGEDRRGRVVCCFNDTWELHGDRWRKGPAAPPELVPRMSHGMSFHANVARVLLFGGHGGSPLGDTWLYDGSSWSRLPGTDRPSPPPRAGAAIAYDTHRARTVLFGGRGESGDLADTWEFDGGAWLEGPSAPEGLSARDGASMAYSQGDHVIFLFGGGNHLTDTWIYDGTWRDGPPAPGDLLGRRDAVMVEDATRRRVVLVAGSTLQATDLGAVWLLDGSGWRRDPSLLPRSSWRNSYEGAFDAEHGRLVLVGGPDGPGDDTWLFDGQEWIEGPAAPEGLTPREGHGMVYDPSRRVSVVFAGLTNMVRNETWIYDGTAWREGPQAPPDLWRRRDPGLAYDADRQVAILFGGDDSARTWELDGARWVRRDVAPSPLEDRGGCALAYDASRRRVVLFGGSQYFSSRQHADTWEYDGTTWAPGPPAPTLLLPRSCHEMVYDPRARNVVLFGGISGGRPLNDTWVYAGEEWSPGPRAPEGLSPRGGHAMTYHSDRARVLLHGGRKGPIADYRAPLAGDAWEYDGQAWSKLPAMEPPEMSARAQHTVVFDEARHCVVLFGGRDAQNEERNDTWELREYKERR